MKLIGSLIAVVMLLAPANALLTPQMQATILRAHNEARSKIKPTAANMQRMVWNPTLALIAQEHVENCEWMPNDMRHAEAEHLFPLGVGENMALNYGSSAIINQNPAQFITEWNSEGQFYNITLNTCEQGRVCDHYTQMMSADTVAVGCGFHVCQEFEFFGAILPLAAFFICNYGPQGEAITNQAPPYVPGKPCSLCPAGKQLCMNNLCEIGMARAPPAMSYPTGPIPIVTVGPGGAVPTGTVDPAQLILGTTPPAPTGATHTGQVGGVTTDASLLGTGGPTAATLPAGATAGPANCTNPATILDREQCWLEAWTDWRTKFDTWVHSNCPGP